MGWARAMGMVAMMGGLWLGGSAVAWAEPQRFDVDPDHASIGFLVSHVGFARVLGQFLEVEGGFTFDEPSGTVSDIRIAVETDSVFTGHKARDAHLRKKDFLWADEHPTMVFVGRRAERTGERTGRIEGDLTLRGVTRPVTFDVTLNRTGSYPFGDRHYAVGISARGSIRRSDFGMNYGVADGLVGDVVEILVEMEGKRQS